MQTFGFARRLQCGVSLEKNTRNINIFSKQRTELLAGKIPAKCKGEKKVQKST
jgi:hypothetical protein